MCKVDVQFKSIFETESMSGINISLTEKAGGTTISLHFAMTPEALMHEIQGCLFELPEELIEEVRQEARSLLDHSRLKMQIRLISLCRKLMEGNNG